MRRAIVLVCAALGGCSVSTVRIGSQIPMGAQLTEGRVIESDCASYPDAYAELVHAARGDLITDVEVSDGRGCAVMRARAVKIASASLAAAPAAPAVARPAWAASAPARLHSGATLRPRPVLEAAPLGGVAPGTALTLKAPLAKGEVTWWYVTFPGGSGWAREADLDALPQ